MRTDGRTNGRTKVIQEVLADLKMLRLSHDCIMIQTYFCGLFKSALKLSALFCLNGIRASWPIMHPRIRRIDLFPNLFVNIYASTFPPSFFFKIELHQV